MAQTAEVCMHAPNPEARARGWCPSLYEPMESGDGLLARVKPPLGRLSVAAVRHRAAASRRWGNGQLELTNRGALQARGLTEATLPQFRDAVLAAGLASSDPAVERRRNLAVSPFSSSAGAALAVELERWIAEDEALAALPPKFGFAIEAPDGDPQPPPGDICFAPEAGGWRIGLAGCKLTGLATAPLAAARAITHRFLALAAELDDPPRRMADLVRRCGHAAIVAGSGVALVDTVEAHGNSAPAIAGRIGSAFTLGLAFGALTVDDLGAAADLAHRFADDNGLRLSPWRALVLTGVSAQEELSVAAQAAGFVVDPGDPRLSVIACAGAPACGGAHAPTREDAAFVASLGPRGLVHLSGCAKGCAHPRPATFTLVAAPDGYGLVRCGRAGDPPERRGLTLADAVQRLAAEPAETR